MEFCPLIKWCLVALYIFGVIVSPIIWGFFYGRQVKLWDDLLRILLYLGWPLVIALLIICIVACIVFGIPALILGTSADSLTDLGANLKVAYENRKKEKKVSKGKDGKE